MLPRNLQKCDRDGRWVLKGFPWDDCSKGKRRAMGLSCGCGMNFFRTPFDATSQLKECFKLTEP